MATNVEDLIFDNAKRLLGDAELMLRHERFATAFALAVLATEEAGKVLLRRWEDDPEVQADIKRHGRHRVKQAIVGSLFSSRASLLAFFQFLDQQEVDLRKVVPELIDNLERQTDDAFTSQAVEAAARAMYESGSGLFLQRSAAGIIDKTKQAAFYVDDWSIAHNITPWMFKRADAEHGINRAKEAIYLVTPSTIAPVVTPMIAAAAKAIYRQHLDRLANKAA